MHAKGLVHRDFRLSNVVQLATQHYMVIDLECAARVTDKPLPTNFQQELRTCSSEALDARRCFTQLSDMYCIGKLLQAAAPPAAGHALEPFISQLLRKEVSAEDALQILRDHQGALDTA